jgi:hypothetical protein
LLVLLSLSLAIVLSVLVLLWHDLSEYVLLIHKIKLCDVGICPPPFVLA